MLQEHHAAGRLSTEEFDERMGKALEARTASDLVGLFFDLPAPRPGLDLAAQPQPEPVVAPWAGAPQAPATWGADDDQLQHRPMARPWFAQWWIILPFVIMGTRGIWWIIPMVALWIWVIWPAIEQNRQRQQCRAAQQPPCLRPHRPGHRAGQSLPPRACGEKTTSMPQCQRRSG